MDNQPIYLWTQIAVAIGTLAVAFLAIWGDWFRGRLASPRLRMRLHSPDGALTLRKNGVRTFYYHLVVSNERSWALARSVRVHCTGIWHKASGETAFKARALQFPVQLAWTPKEQAECTPNIGPERRCDIGFVDENGQGFALECYQYPNLFSGMVGGGDAMRVRIEAVAENCPRASALALEISCTERDFS